MRKRIFCLFLSMVFVMLNISESVYAEEVIETVSEKSDNSKFEIEYVLNSDWGEGFNAQINVSSDVEIKDWTLEFDYARNITDTWDAVVESHDGNRYVLKCKEYNAVIEANQRITIGFNGNGGEATDEITNVSLYSGDKKLNDSGENTDEEPSDIDNPDVDEELDSDGDGIPDYVEELFGLDKNSQDTDRDGLSDYDELYVVLTNPSEVDTDNNGINDADDDLDEDGLTNAEELKYGISPITVDTDRDNLSDYDEIFIYHTDPLVADTDGDGLLDGDDVKLGFDPLLEDTDGMY